MKPPLVYFGGKSLMAPRIAELLPPHDHYVEPFSGSLAVLLAKPPSRMETVNDLDGDLQTFWRVLRDDPGELERACALTPHSREEHQDAYDRPAGLSEVERARRVWVCLTQGRGGQLKPTGWRHFLDKSNSNFGMPRYLASYVHRMPAAAARLASVSLENRAALDVIASYGRYPGTCLYVDPPYLGSTRVSGGYVHEMRTEKQHRELADALHACKASVVLSGYPSALYDEMFTGWWSTTIAASTGQGGTWANRTEVLWSNRVLQPSLFDVEASWHAHV